MSPSSFRPLAPVLLAAFLSAAGLAAAQPAPAPAGAEGAAQGHHRWHDPAQRQQMAAQRLAQLKERLQITPAQEGNWNTFAAAMQPPARDAGARPDRAEWQRLTTPERIDRMQAMRAQRQARSDQRALAVKTFYATLTPAQQQTFDSQTLRMMAGPMGHGGRRPGMEGRAGRGPDGGPAAPR